MSSFQKDEVAVVDGEMADILRQTRFAKHFNASKTLGHSREVRTD